MIRSALSRRIVLWPPSQRLMLAFETPLSSERRPMVIPRRCMTACTSDESGSMRMGMMPQFCAMRAVTRCQFDAFHRYRGTNHPLLWFQPSRGSQGGVDPIGGVELMFDPAVVGRVGPAPQLEIVVRERCTGIVLVQMVLPSLDGAALLPPMPLSTASPREAATEGLLSTVAGRIDASTGELHADIDAWIARIFSRRGKSRSILVYRATVKAAIRECGWTSRADLTWDAITSYLSSKVQSGTWKRVTYNRNLVVMRSFTKFLARSERIAKDPLADEMNASDDSGEGARAATLDEARRQIAYAAGAVMRDRRSRCPRDLVWALGFSAGLRGGEAEQLVWQRHVFIDEPIPYLLFTPDINKNGRREEVPLTRELAARLRAHRENMRALSKLKPVHERKNPRTGAITPRPVSPDDPEGVVFPWVPTRVEFRRDRDAAGIETSDRRGRGYSSHSARKYFETQLIELGVHGRVIDALMRHKGGVEARYRDMTLEKLSECVNLLPTLWTSEACAVGKSVHNPVDSTPHAGNYLTSGGDQAEHEDASPVPESDTSVKPPRPSASASDWQERAAREWLRGLIDLQQPGHQGPGPRVDRSTNSDPEMPRGGLEPPTSGL
jgi:integrase